MTARAFIVTTAIVLTSATFARAQRPEPQPPLASAFIDPTDGLTLDQAIAQALEREPAIRVARTELDVARGTRRQAQLRPNPSASFMQQSEPKGTDSQSRFEVEWPLDLFRWAPRVAVAEREVEATQAFVANSERLLAADVRTKYGEVAAAVRELTVADDLVAAIRRQHDLVRARVEQGATPPLDRDMLRVELQRLESERLILAGRAEQTLIELKRLLGAPPDAPIRLRETLEQLVQREIAAPLATVTTFNEERADLREAEARIRLADARIESARSEGRFNVSLFGSYTRMDAGFPQQGFTSRGDLERVRGLFHYIAGGGLVTLPLRNRNQGEIGAAQARRRGAMARLEEVQLTARMEIASARARDSRAREAFGLYTSESRALARQNLEVVGQTYELGRMTLFEVLAEQRRYLDLERAYTSVLWETYEARQALRRALGDVR